MEDYSRFVPDVHFEKIPIKNLVSNQNYQRNISMTHVHRTAHNFDPYQINPVKVSRRDGINYVFNGQHTIEIIAEVAGTREVPVWCMVYDDLDYVGEADIFANQQKYVKALTSYEIFMANIEAGNNTQMIIKELVESYGLVLSTKKIPGNICAIASLELIYGKYGFHVLDRTIRLCVITWEGDVNSFNSCMLKGIALIVVAFGDSLNDEIFKDKLGDYSPKKLTRLAKDRKAGVIGYAEAILEVYNSKMRTPLKWQKLHSVLNNYREYQADLRDDNE